MQVPDTRAFVRPMDFDVVKFRVAGDNREGLELSRSFVIDLLKDEADRPLLVESNETPFIVVCSDGLLLLLVYRSSSKIEDIHGLPVQIPVVALKGVLKDLWDEHAKCGTMDEEVGLLPDLDVAKLALK